MQNFQLHFGTSTKCNTAIWYRCLFWFWG